MKTVILTLSTLASLSTTTFAETKPNVPAKEASQIFKAAGFSKTKHGWPDIENGGPGFCFAVYRWNGQKYDVNRYEYNGKACTLDY